MDFAISKWIVQTFGQSKVFAVVCRLVTELGSTIAIIIYLLLLLSFVKTRKLGIYSTIAVLLSLMINNVVLKNIICRERPFIIDETLSQICINAGYKFPTGFSMASGHSTISMTLAVMIFLFNKKYGTLAIILSLIIGLSRVCLCVHYLTDVLVGFALGIIVSYITNLILKKYSKNKEKYEKNSISNK